MDHSSYTSDSSEIITLLFISIIYAIDYWLIYVISIIKSIQITYFVIKGLAYKHTVYILFQYCLGFRAKLYMYVLRRSVILEADFKLRIQNYYEKIIHTSISHFYVP